MTIPPPNLITASAKQRSHFRPISSSANAPAIFPHKKSGEIDYVTRVAQPEVLTTCIDLVQGSCGICTHPTLQIPKTRNENCHQRKNTDRMQGKNYLLSLMTLLCLRNFGIQAQKAMSSLSGIYSVAYVTVPSNEVAKKLARGIVENKLAACVNIIPGLTSVYEWENKINEDSELLLMIKTRTEAVGNLTTYVKANHPYTVCEVISLPIENGNEEYLNWIGGVVPPSSKKTP